MDLVPKWFNRLPRPSIGRFFDDVESELSPLFARFSGLSVSSDDSHVYVEAHLPGLSSDEIDVSIDADNVLWIKGEKKEIEEDKKKKYYRRSQKEFSYCIPLTDELDLGKEIDAKCKNGVMYITFTKRRGKQPEAKKIKVKEEK